MDQGVLQNVANAVMVMQDRDADQDTKHQALKYLDAFKSEADNVPAYGLYMASIQEQSMIPDHNNLIRHFGLQVLEHCVQHCWESYTQEQKEEMKRALLHDLIMTGTYPLLQEQTFIFEKIASLVSEVAIREWPQRWPGFLDILLEIASNSSTQTFIVLTCLKTFTETIFKFNESLTNARRNDLVQGLNACLPSLLPFFSNLLVTCVPQETDNADESQRQEYYMVVRMLLKALAAFVDWVPLKSLYKNNLVLLLCELLSVEQHRRAAADCLLLIVERKGPRDERLSLLDILQHLGPIVASVQILTQSSLDDDDVYAFVKRLTQVITVLGTNQLCSLCGHGASVRQPPKSFDDYVRVLYEFTLHPSLVVSSLTLLCWTSLLRNDLLRQTQIMADLQLPLAEALCDRIVQRGNPEVGFHGDSAPFCEQDFSDVDEWQQFFSLYKSRALTILGLVAGNFPTKTINMLASSLSNLVENTPAALQSAPRNPDGSLSSHAEVAEAWDAMGSIWEACASVAHAQFKAHLAKGHDSGGMAVLSECFQAALTWSSQEPKLYLCELSVLGALTVCLNEMPDALEATLNNIFTAMEFRAEEDKKLLEERASSGEVTQTGLTDGARVRRKACSILISLCKKPPPCLFEAMGAISAYANQLLTKPSTSEMLRRMLVAALVASFNNLPTAEEQQEQLQTLFGAILQEWLNLEHVVSSPEELVAYGGLNAPQADYQNNRTMMMTVLSSISVALSSTKPRPQPYAKATANGNGGCDAGGVGSSFPSQRLCELALPLVFALTRTLHMLETKECTALPGELRMLLGMRRSDLILHLPNAPDDSARKMDNFMLWVDRSQLWLSSLRTNVYTILESSAKHGLLYREDVLLPFANAVLTGLGDMSSHNMKAFVRRVMCPFERYMPRSPPGLAAAAEVLGRLYGAAADYIERTLPSMEEGEEGARPNGHGEAEPSAPTVASSFLTSEQREIVEDAVRSSTVDAVLVHFHQVLSDHCQPAADRGKDEIFVSPLAQFLLNSNDTAPQVLRIMQATLTRGSGSLAKKAAAVTARIVHTTQGSDVYRQVVIFQLLPATLKAMFHHGQHPECLEDFVTLLMRCIDSLHADDIGACFASVPNIDVNAILTYYQEVQEGAIKNSKSKRSRLKKLFRSCIGLHVSQWAADNVKVLNLPEKLFLSSKRRGQEQEEEEEDLGVIQDFFDS